MSKEGNADYYRNIAFESLTCSILKNIEDEARKGNFYFRLNLNGNRFDENLVYKIKNDFEKRGFKVTFELVIDDVEKNIRYLKFSWS